MLGGLRFSMRANLFVNILMIIRLLKWRTSSVRKLLRRVVRGWHLHNTGEDQWLPERVPKRSHQVAVHLPDKFHRYLFGTYGFTFAMIRAASEEFVPHRDHHAEGPLVALRLTLREGVQVSDFGR